MRKLFVSIAAALMLGFSAMADEGMWMLPLLQKLNAGAMKDLGCRLTPDQIYSVNHSSLKDAIVIFGGGCSRRDDLRQRSAGDEPPLRLQQHPAALFRRAQLP